MANRKRLLPPAGIHSFMLPLFGDATDGFIATSSLMWAWCVTDLCCHNLISAVESQNITRQYYMSQQIVKDSVDLCGHRSQEWEWVATLEKKKPFLYCTHPHSNTDGTVHVAFVQPAMFRHSSLLSSKGGCVLQEGSRWYINTCIQHFPLIKPASCKAPYLPNSCKPPPHTYRTLIYTLCFEPNNLLTALEVCIDSAFSAEKNPLH